MAEKLYQAFSVTGSANTEVLDTGISSTDTEKKRLVAILINVSGHIGNQIRGWLEREKKVDIYDYVLDTSEASGTDMYKSINKLGIIPLDLEIPVGQTFKIGINSGATAKNIYGAYQYEIIA